MDGVDQLNAGGMHDHDPSTNVMNLPLYFYRRDKESFLFFPFSPPSLLLDCKRNTTNSLENETID